MATLRLFANLRELAGAGEIHLDGDTVDDVLAAATTRFGPAFAEALRTAQTWVNGEQAGPDTPVRDTDEVAVIPPVSGGETVVAGQPDVVGALLVPALAAAAAIANVVSLPLFVAVVAAAAMIWLWDLSELAAARGRPFNPIPAVVAVAIAANGAYRWGEPGLAGAVALGVLVMLVWAVVDPRQRQIDRLAISLVLAVTASLGTGSLVLVRLGTPELTTVAAFLLMMVGAGGLTFVVQRYGPVLPGVDPNVATVVGAWLGAVVAGAVAETLDVWNLVLAAALAAGGFIGGRALGSLVRAGQVMHTVRSPGVLSTMDGAVLGAGLFWIGRLLFS